MRVVFPLRLAACVLALAAAWRPHVRANEAGQPFVRVYSAAETGATDETRCAVQDARGLMLFGTRGGVLEFDGERWQRLAVPTTGWVNSLAATADGLVWVLADGEFGRFRSTPEGGRVYESLPAAIPAPLRARLTLSHRIAALDNELWLALEGTLLRWTQDHFATELQQNSALRFYSNGPGELLARSDHGPTYRLGPRGAVPLPNVPPLDVSHAWLSPLGDGERWLFAASGEALGVLRQDGGSARFTPLPARVDRIDDGARLADGGFVFFAGRNQVAVLGPDLQLRYFVGPAEGLPLGRAHVVALDRAGGIWICGAPGIARIDDRMPATIFDATNGLEPATLGGPPASRFVALRPVEAGPAVAPPSSRFTLPRADLVRGVQRVHGTLVAQLANEGVLAYDEESRRFAAVPGLTQATVARHTPAGWLAREPERLVFLPADGSPAGRWLPVNFVGETSIADADHFTVPLSDRLVRFTRRAGTWNHVAVPHGFNDAHMAAFAETPDVWWLSLDDTIVRLRLHEDRVVARDTFGAAQGLEARAVKSFAACEGEWLALTTNGPLRLDRAAQRFVPFERFTAALPAGARFIRQLVTDPTGRTWLIAQVDRRDSDTASVVVVERDGRPHPLPLDLRLRLGRIMSLQLDADAPGGPVLWLIGFNTIARLELARWPAAIATPVLNVNFRAAQIVGGEPLPLVTSAPSGAKGAETIQGPRTLRVTYAAPHFPLSGRIEYQTRLDGLEPAWSDWQPASAREFTNLPSGRYALHVRARHQDTVGPAAVYAFAVVPPWWRSGPALALWTFCAAGVVIATVRWRLGALRRRARELENLVTARTAELRVNEEQLRVARDAAEAANRAKSIFLAHMSHELRTPLNGILGYAQVLRRDATQSSAARDRLGVIVDSGEHLLALINEVLDLAKIEAGKMELRPADASPDRLARGVADLMRARCEEKGLAFSVEIAPGLPRLVRTDEQKLRQALLNLLGNAVKFTARGSVAFSVAPTADGRVRFCVEDTGPGISAERQRTLFTAFDSTAVHGGQGTGLGLALSQRMVELLGGRIQVQSPAHEGGGSRFWFDLPLPEVGSVQPFEGSAHAAVIGYEGARLRLLVVDDDATNRAVLRDLLGSIGFVIEEAADGEQALARARAFPPAAVLLDLRFAHGPDGFTLAQALRRESALAGTKLIAVSASVFESDRHEALAAGCDAFLAKPFKEDQLFSVLAAQLGLRWLVRDVPAAPPANANGGGALPEAELAALRALVRSGDLRGVRQRLAALRSTHPQEAALLRQLDELAAAFELKRLRELLAENAPVA